MLSPKCRPLQPIPGVTAPPLPLARRHGTGYLCPTGKCHLTNGWSRGTSDYSYGSA